MIYDMQHNNHCHVLSIGTKALSIKEQIDKFDYVEIKFYSSKVTIKNLKVQTRVC